MAIEKKPEQQTLTGDEARAAIVAGAEKIIGRRVDPKTIEVGYESLNGKDPDIRITVDIIGGLKGPKAGTKRKPRKDKADKPSAEKPEDIGIGPSFQS